MDEKQREYYKEQIGDLFFEDDIISVPMVIYGIMFDYTAYYSLDFLEQIGKTIKVSCLWGEFIPKSINRSNVLSNGEKPVAAGEKPVAACCFAGAVYFIYFLFPEWLHYTPIAKVDAIIHELFHVGGGGRITPHIPDFDFIVGAMVQEYFPEMNPRLKMALALLDEEEKFIKERKNMQQEFDLADYELANLKRKIDELDPVVQAEVVVKYLNKNYFQKKLGEKLGKTRDWVAKRVQFIRFLEKLPKSEQEEVKNLVQHHTISMDVVILVADLPYEQRQQIISKNPTVEEARRMVDELKQNESTAAKLRMLEQEKSQAYSGLELMVKDEIYYISQIKMGSAGFISSNLSKKITDFIKHNWTENYRFGMGISATNDEGVKERIAWLEKPEVERIKELRRYIEDCHNLCQNVVDELEEKGVELIIYKQEVQSLYTKLRDLEDEVNKLKNSSGGVRGVSINFGDGIPPLVLNIAGDQFKMLHRALAMAFHPDKHPEDSQQYAELMKTINSGYDKYLGKNVGKKSTQR